MRGIYKITNTTNGKCYIGKSENLGNRIKYHTKTLKAGYNKNKHMQNAYNVAGVGNFTIEVVEVLSENDDINEREIYWISYYNSNNREYGYNKTLGGDGSNGFFECLTDKEKEEYLKKNRHKNKGKDNPNYGKHCYTDGNIIKYISDEDIEEYTQNGWRPGIPETTRINEHYANLGEKNGFYGKKHSEETRRKLSECRKGKNNWNYGKLIYHKENQQKYISPNEVEEYEANGWSKGMAPYIKKKISDKTKGKKTNTQNKNAIKYLYDGKEFYGWRKLKKYLNENGYSKISEATIVKLSNGLPVRGYDDLFGKIITNKEDEQKGGKL